MLLPCATTPVNKTYSIQFAQPKGTLLEGQAGTITIDFTTVNIPNGAKVELKSSSDFITVPATADVNSNRGSFIATVKSGIAPTSYIITATYSGQSFNSNISVKPSVESYIQNISISNDLTYRKSDSTKITVVTKNVPNNAVLNVNIAGSDLVIENKDVKVQADKAVFVVKSTSSTQAGAYKFTASYLSESKEINVSVVDDGLYHSGNLSDPNSGSSLSSSGNYDTRSYIDITTASTRYIPRVYAQNMLEYGYADSSRIILETMDIPNGTEIYPSVSGSTNSSLTLDRSCKVQNNQAVFTINNRAGTSRGEYIINITYNGFTAKGRIIVTPDGYYYNNNGYNNGYYNDGMNYYGNGYIREISVNNTLSAGIVSQTQVNVYTQNIPDGTAIYPSIPSGLYMSDNGNSNIYVYNNRASFVVSNMAYTGVGSYRISLSYRDSYGEATIRVVSDTAPYLSNISYSNNFIYGEKTISHVTVFTSGIPNDKLLTITISNGLGIGSNTTMVKNNMATFDVWNLENTPLGLDYTVNVSYSGYNTAVRIPVVSKDDVGNVNNINSPYITNARVGAYLLAGVSNFTNVTANTSGIPENTVLRPYISTANSNISFGTAVVHNNYLSFDAYGYENTVAGSYLIKIPYGGYEASVVLTVR